MPQPATERKKDRKHRDEGGLASSDAIATTKDGNRHQYRQSSRTPCGKRPSQEPPGAFLQFNQRGNAVALNLSGGIQNLWIQLWCVTAIRIQKKPAPANTASSVAMTLKTLRFHAASPCNCEAQTRTSPECRVLRVEGTVRSVFTIQPFRAAVRNTPPSARFS